jgi:hypothetical protein
MMLLGPLSLDMPAGLHLIFDKSALQSFNLDETNWLDHFYTTVITPLFFAEALADLEKEVGRGKTPEQVVGALAHKTPDMNSAACPHHAGLVAGVLYGGELPLDGRIPRGEGKVVELDGQQGLYYSKQPEEEALDRWYKNEFLDVERQFAKGWRRNLCNINHDQEYAYFQKWFLLGRPKSLPAVKTMVDAYLDGSPQDGVMRFGMTMIGIPEDPQVEIMQRWRAANSPPVREFAPYMRHILGVDLFFHLGVAADLISRDRPKGKADNKVDMAYLYYLPFCHVFVSGDNLHKRTVPLFLRSDQSFVDAAEMKADLAKLDAHYSVLPEAEKAKGFFKIAPHPPLEGDYLIAKLWDKRGRQWREHALKPPPLDQEHDKKIIAELKKISDASKAADPSARLNLQDAAFLTINRTVLRRKGKWKRMPDEA